MTSWGWTGLEGLEGGVLEEGEPRARGVGQRLEGLEAESAGCSSWNLVDNFVDKWVDALPGQAHTERVKEDEHDDRKPGK